MTDKLFNPTALGFSPEEVARAEELGIDLGLLYENLQMTPEERAQQHDACVNQMMTLQGKIGLTAGDEN